MNARKWSKGAINALTVLAVLALTVGLTHAQGPEELDGLPAGFDGDGCADLAIGVPGESVGTIEGAGAVNILYGSAPNNGLTASGDEIWHQDVAGVVDEAEEDDIFGSALAVGDFDGDGYADLAIGVPGEAVGGAVNILYGMAYGLESEFSQMWHQDISGINGVAEEGDGFGSALAVGDFDGDGYDDLAIGVPYEAVGTIGLAGAVNIIYGSVGGLTAAGDQLWHQDVAGVADEAEEYDWFGSALAAGDFDGDGYDDLAIGVPYEAVGTISSAGAVNTIYGSSGGLTTGDQLWHQDITGVKDEAETSDHFGDALAVGDFDGDGYADLAIGVPDEDLGSINEEVGVVNIIYGSGGGLTSTGDQLWHQDVAGVVDEAEPIDWFGRALAAGDFDFDGYDDLAVGVYREAVGAVVGAGAVHVFYGASGGLTAARDWWFHQNTMGMLDTAELGDYFGGVLATGDFDGDLYADLAIGVPGEAVGAIGGAGAVSVVYGSPSGLSTEGNQFWHQDSPFIEGVAETDDRFGSSLAALPIEVHRVHLPLVVRNY